MSRFPLVVIVFWSDVCGKVGDAEFLELTIESINALLNDFALRIELAIFTLWFILNEESGLAMLFVLFSVDDSAVSIFLTLIKFTFSHVDQLKIFWSEFDQSLSRVDHVVLRKVLEDRLVFISNDSGISSEHWLDFVKEDDLLWVIEVFFIDVGGHSLNKSVILWKSSLLSCLNYTSVKVLTIWIDFIDTVVLCLFANM